MLPVCRGSCSWRLDTPICSRASRQRTAGLKFQRCNGCPCSLTNTNPSGPVERVSVQVVLEFGQIAAGKETMRIPALDFGGPSCPRRGCWLIHSSSTHRWLAQARLDRRTPSRFQNLVCYTADAPPRSRAGINWVRIDIGVELPYDNEVAQDDHRRYPALRGAKTSTR